MTYFAYLDEFGHIGPYISRADPRYKDSPVFGLAGFVLPAEAVRGFGTWFFQRKCELLDFEIRRSGEHPTVWEKKGASLFTVANVTRYRELRNFTNRLFNTIETLGGFVFYVGIEKTAAPADHDPNQLYKSVLVEAIKRIDDFCEQDCDPPASFIVILDEHDQRSALIAAAARSMYGHEPRRHVNGRRKVTYSRQPSVRSSPASDLFLVIDGEEDAGCGRCGKPRSSRFSKLPVGALFASMGSVGVHGPGVGRQRCVRVA